MRVLDSAAACFVPGIVAVSARALLRRVPSGAGGALVMAGVSAGGGVGPYYS